MRSQKVGSRVSIAALVSLQMLSAFLAQLFILRQFQAGSTTDVYVAAQAIPLFLAAAVTLSLQHVWQPELSRTPNRVDALDKLSKAQGQALVFFGVLVAVLITTLPWWPMIIFPGLSIQEVRLLHLLFPILLASGALSCHAHLNATALRATSRFVVPEAWFAGTEVTALITILLSLRADNIALIATIALSKSAVQAAAMQLIAGNPGIKPITGMKETRILKSLTPLILGAGIYKTSPLIDRYWSSQAQAGSIALFFLVHSGVAAAARIVDRTFCQPETPQIAKLWEAGDVDNVRRIYRKCMLKIAVITTAGAISLLLLKPHVIQIVILGLKLSSESAEEVWGISFFMLGYLFAASSGNILVSTFYAAGDTKTPVRISLISFAIGAAVKSIGFMLGQLEGLAAGLAMQHLFSLLLFYLVIEGRIKAILKARTVTPI